MKDLRILEQQQRESQHKLQVARLEKQKQQETQDQLQHQLEMLQYQNGTRRAALQRMRSALSEQSRDMQDTRSSVDTSGNDLQELDM